jgi:SAM-dependent methyltransferase
MTDSLDPDTAIALRPVHDFPPSRVSVFEDPADEKSSHASQRYSSLLTHYRDRGPGWYESVTKQFAGLERVLDLGTGPGLSLDALRAHGVREPIGVDRWQGFLRDGEVAGRKIILHDLTLPMPFFRSGSFDGVFSHYALDYISPIGVEQVMREARRLLAPEGLMVLYLAGGGLALGDLVRTTPYDESAFTKLLRSAGFEDFEVEQPEDRRNTIVRARGPGPDRTGDAGDATALEYEAGREVQVSASIQPSEEAGGGPLIGIELGDGERSIGYWPQLEPEQPAEESDAVMPWSVGARLVAVTRGQFELHVWTWRGSQAEAVDTVRLQACPDVIRLRLESEGGALEPHGAWYPAPAMLEVPGDAYTAINKAAPDHQADEDWRARGRQVIVAREGEDPDVLRAAAESKDHFLVVRPDPGAPADLETLDRDWQEERLHGIVFDLERAVRPESLPLLLWADFRGALVYLEPASWAELESAAGDLPPSLRSPLLAVDPRLSGRSEAQAEAEGFAEASILEALERTEALHLVLSAPVAAGAEALFERHPTRVLIGEADRSNGGDGRLADEATENLRYLTERTLLMWFRSTSGKTGSELGRSTP